MRPFSSTAAATSLSVPSFDRRHRQLESGAVRALLGFSLLFTACTRDCREPAHPESSAAAVAAGPGSSPGTTAPGAAASPAGPAENAPSANRLGKIVTPDGALAPIVWTEEELGKDVALRTLRQTDAASYHVVHLLRAEKPHAHDRSDLSVFVLSGAVNMHIGGRVVPVGPGDVIDVPKGVPHWAENASPGASIAYVVFAPAFDGKDRRPVDDPAAPSGSPR